MVRTTAMIGLILSYRIKSWRDPLFFEVASSLPTLDVLAEADELEKEDEAG